MKEDETMNDFSFDEMLDFAAKHTSISSGTKLVKSYRDLLVRYDEVRERKRIASFLHTLLKDSSYYKTTSKPSWTEENIYNYLDKYEI